MRVLLEPTPRVHLSTVMQLGKLMQQQGRQALMDQVICLLLYAAVCAHWVAPRDYRM
jgi:hypothetical protein